MRYVVITDTHFNHDKMVEYCGRPANHSEIIWKNLYKLDYNDVLIHLGDVCIGRDEAVHERLKGVPALTRVLVRGNHDRKTNSWYLSHGWSFVCDRFGLEYADKKIMFSHIPVQHDGWYDINIHGHFHNNLERLKLGDFVVKGEAERNKHDLSVLNERHRLLAVEKTNYNWVTLDSLLK